jgi:hypothetical protein
MAGNTEIVVSLGFFPAVSALMRPMLSTVKVIDLKYL